MELGSPHSPPIPTNSSNTSIPLPRTLSIFQEVLSAPRRSDSIWRRNKATLPSPSTPKSSQTFLAPSSQSQIPRTARIQLFPHPEAAQHPHDDSNLRYLFTPIETDLKPGFILRLGRKVDRKKESKRKENEQGPENTEETVHRFGTSHASSSGNMDAVVDQGLGVENEHHLFTSQPNKQVSLRLPATGTEGLLVNNSYQNRPKTKSSNEGNKNVEFVAFKSKVVSRTHAEFWIGNDNQVYLRDVGSSSGSFLNRLRLSPPGIESRPYLVSSGDTIQLGVDYQGRQEDIYRSVIIKVFITIQYGNRPKPNSFRLRTALRQLLAAMNGRNKDENTATECCICLCQISTSHALFLAPCSHCFHYKCVVPLLTSKIMFQCPLCRQVTNLEAAVFDEENTDIEDEVPDQPDDDEAAAVGDFQHGPSCDTIMKKRALMKVPNQSGDYDTRGENLIFHNAQETSGSGNAEFSHDTTLSRPQSSYPITSNQDFQPVKSGEDDA